jgi:ABC-type transport system involved in multi-copper enzyme maturation permease subunit
MIRVFRSEWRKLRRPTLFAGTLGIVFGLSVLITALLFILLDSDGGNGPRGRIITRETLALPSGLYLGFTNFAGLLGTIALSVFAAQTALEYTNGTLRNLLVRQPKRLVLLAGKYLAMCSFALLTVIISAIGSIGISLLLAPTKDINTDAWFSSESFELLYSNLGNVYLSAIAYGTVGMAVGIILRSPISSISISLAWILILEGILSFTVDGLDKWLPGQLMSLIAESSNSDISYTYALVGTAIYLTIFSGIATTLFVKRDVAN